MSQLLESGDLQNHIFRTLQPSYAKRYRSMMFAIGKTLIPLGVTLPQINREIIGGYFIWLSLPTPLNAAEVASCASEDESLIIAPGPIFGVYGDEKVVDLERKVRVCFSWEEEANLAEGIERLGRVITRMQRSRSVDQSVMADPSRTSSSVGKEDGCLHP